LTAILIVGFIGFSIVDQIGKQAIKQTYFYLGTIIDITLYGTNDQTILTEVSTLINDYDNLFDRNDPSSDVNKINQLEVGEVLSINDMTYQLIDSALSYSDLSDGYFDITINPIVDLWQIGTEFQHLPDHEDIVNILPQIGFEKIKLLPNNQITLLSETSLDLGAIAKGFIADEIRTLLLNKGIKKALINLGGNVYALGSSTDKHPWNIGVRHPDIEVGGALLKVMLEDKSVVTSGISERFFEEDGKLYHHIFNPYTGYPVDNNLVSLTVISDDSIDGDALSTSLFALGEIKAFEMINSLTNIQIVVVTKDHNIYYSASLEEKIELFDESYELIKK